VFFGIPQAGEKSFMDGYEAVFERIHVKKVERDGKIH